MKETRTLKDAIGEGVHEILATKDSVTPQLLTRVLTGQAKDWMAQQFQIAMNRDESVEELWVRMKKKF